MNTSLSQTLHRPSPDIRIVQLDVLRGVAVLGIYWINVAVFALPYSVYILPVLAGEAVDANKMCWAFSEVFVDGTMRGLFSMLFGASAMLFLDESRLAGDGLAVVDRYYRRTLLLMLFGMIHAYLLLWPYDILYAYGLLGLFLFPLRHLSARLLLIAGVVMLMLGDSGVFQVTEGNAPLRDNKPVALNSSDAQSEPEKSDVPASGIADSVVTQIEDEIELYRSGYLRIFKAQYKETIEQQSLNMYDTHVFDIGGMMLIGMALFKWGVISGRRSRKFYLAMAGGGYVFGLLIRGPDVYTALTNGFELSRLLGESSDNYNLGRLAMTLGHIGVIVFLCQISLFEPIMRVLARLGRLALTNYIMQSLVSIFIFYGIGLGLYGQLERYQLIYVCFGIWLLQIVFSIYWLKKFYYGPLEWVWRSLIYGEKQRLRKKQVSLSGNNRILKY